MRRRAIIQVDPELIGRLIGLPDDVECIEVQPCTCYHKPQMAFLLVESDAFPETPRGGCLLHCQPIMATNAAGRAILIDFAEVGGEWRHPRFCKPEIELEDKEAHDGNAAGPTAGATTAPIGAR